jgi:hypothetical protein
VKCTKGFPLKLAALALLALAFLSPLHALTLSEIRTEVRLRVRDSNSSRQRFTDAQLNALINQTHRDVINFSNVIRKQDDFELVSGTTYYLLPTDLIQIERVTWRRRNISEQTLQSLDSQANFGDWQIASGPPKSYFQDPSQPGYIGFQPWPLGSTSTGTVVVFYSAQGAELSADADEPFNGDDRFQEWGDLLIYEPAYKISVIDGLIQEAAEYKTLYETRLRSMMEKIGLKGNYLPGFSGPNPR